MVSHRSFFCALFVCAFFSSAAHAAQVIRGPYLQLQTDDGITIAWRTDVATDSVVRFGAAPGSLDESVTMPGSTTEHRVTLSGLGAGQSYYYSVGDSIAPLAGDASYRFSTAPPAGQPATTRIWVIGDSGTADANAIAVRNAYASWAGANPADLWLMLGDNAYDNGTDAEYQAAVFEIYPIELRQMSLWPTLGNHDGITADSATQTGPYYDIFELPTQGEAGGYPSGTEAYYSFDYANIHFICLDSYDTSRAPGGAMMQWLEADLAVNTQPWVIAFWHHPPYSKGSHNSDTEGALIDMRQNALPLLEAWGVDLVLTGHSHSYERSYLLDGHYGSSATLDPQVHLLDAGDGRESGDGAYEKPATIAAQNAGAVYAVAGSSGKTSGGALNHPAMVVSLNALGSLVLDLAGDRLDATFINQSGTVLDSFTLIKTPDDEPPLLDAATAEDANHVRVEFSEKLDTGTAGDPANYAIAGVDIAAAVLLADGRTVRLTTSTLQDGASYTLLVSGVEDLIGNVIAPGSSIGFDYFELFQAAFQDGLAPQPDYAGTRDAYLREASPTTAFGASTSLQVDGDEPSGSGSDMNILLAWDLGTIPAGATVQAAELVLEVTNPSSGSYVCNRVLRSWQEAQVTWNQAASGAPWGSPGAEAGSDRDSTPLCTVNAATTGPLTVPLNAAGVAAVQAWVDDPGGNHGLVISNTATTDGADFHSRESSAALARPRLNVTYRTSVLPPPYVDQYAAADVATSGTAAGSYLNTHGDDGIVQALTERESGGRKNQRHSLLEHTWRFPVVPGSSITLHANAWSSGSADGDSFVFAWSSDNSSWSNLFTVSSSSPANWQSATLPASGTLYLRVTDTNRQSGHTALDTVYVDQLYIRSENGTLPPNLPPQAAFEADCTALHCSFTDTSSDGDGNIVSWSWNLGDGSTSSAQNPAHDYAVAGTYPVSLTVTDDDGASDEAGMNVTVTSAGAITLAASGYKLRGVHVADLSWSGASGAQVEVVRNGSVIATTANDGAHTDNTGNKGAQSYTYRVCEAGGAACSNEVTLVF